MKESERNLRETERDEMGPTRRKSECNDDILGVGVPETCTTNVLSYVKGEKNVPFEGNDKGRTVEG